MFSFILIHMSSLNLAFLTVYTFCQCLFHQPRCLSLPDAFLPNPASQEMFLCLCLWPFSGSLGFFFNPVFPTVTENFFFHSHGCTLVICKPVHAVLPRAWGFYLRLVFVFCFFLHPVGALNGFHLISCNSNVKIFQQLITAVISSGRAVPLTLQFSCCRGGAGAQEMPLEIRDSWSRQPKFLWEGPAQPTGTEQLHLRRCCKNPRRRGGSWK